MFPIDAARWSLSLEVIRVQRTGEKFEQKDLRRVRALVRELSGCTPAMAKRMVVEVAMKETFSKALMAKFPMHEGVTTFRKQVKLEHTHPRRHTKKRDSKKKKKPKKKVLKH